jgi:hypothetical protein
MKELNLSHASIAKKNSQQLQTLSNISTHTQILSRGKNSLALFRTAINPIFTSAL